MSKTRIGVIAGLIMIGAVVTGIPHALPADATSPARAPSSILNLTNWELEVPVIAKGADHPEQVRWPQLQTYSNHTFFHLNSARNGVVFWVNVGGAIIPNSQFARTELRQMTDNGSQKVWWSNTHGTHTMTIREAIVHLPKVHPALAVAQLHAKTHYFVIVLLDGTRLWVKTYKEPGRVLTENYRLGTVFTIKLVTAGGRVLVYYNGALKVEIAQTCNTCYFKAGAYLQDNLRYGDKPSAFGKVVMYSIEVSYRS